MFVLVIFKKNNKWKCNQIRKLINILSKKHVNIVPLKFLKGKIN